MCLAEVVPDYPSVISSASGCRQAGHEGILFAPRHPPTLCQATFQQCIISVKNPSRDLTNSNLEQASILAQVDVAASLYNLWELTLATLNDNSAAILS